jgi:hypothetical protein
LLAWNLIMVSQAGFKLQHNTAQHSGGEHQTTPRSRCNLALRRQQPVFGFNALQQQTPYNTTNSL